MYQYTSLRTQECMDFLSPDCWPISCWKNNQTNIVIVRARPVETWLAPSAVHTNSCWFWGQACWQRACIAFESNSGRKLHHCHQVGRQAIHWYHIRLGLQATTGPSANAKLCGKGTETIQTWIERKTRCNLSLGTGQVWSQETICNAGIDSTIARQKK